MIKEFVFVTMVAIETRIIQNHEFYSYLMPHKKWVDWITDRSEKMSQPENEHSEKKGPNVKKHILLLFTTTFHNFAMKIETSLVKRMLKLKIVQ